MTTTNTTNFEKVEQGVKDWVSLNGEYTGFTIEQKMPMQNGTEGFFLVEHEDTVEIIFAWSSSFSDKIQISIEYSGGKTLELVQAAKTIFGVLANRIN